MAQRDSSPDSGDQAGDEGCVEAFLNAAVAGDEITARRALSSGTAGLGEDTPIAVGEFVDRVRGVRVRYFW